MNQSSLDNLVRIGQLKREEPDPDEIRGLLHSGRVRLAEYEGVLDVDEALLEALLRVSRVVCGSAEELVRNR